MDIQLSILEFFQTLRSPILNSIFLIFTISTELPVLVLFTSAMYWCINKKVGQKMLFALSSNIILNTGIKEFVKAKRPIGIKGLNSIRVSTATGYSFPSGHTQSATTFWTSLMIIFKNRYIYVIGTIIALGVGISRLYLALHWPIDVLFGWIFGIIFTILFCKIFDYIDKSKNYKVLFLILGLFALVLLIIDSIEYIKPLGLMTGFIVGYIIEDKYIKFETNIDKDKFIFINLCKFLIGIFTLALVHITFKQIMPNKAIYDYIRYSITVFYGVAGVPYLFKLFKLN